MPIRRWMPAEIVSGTGYTGTMVWADPDNGTLFIFLSNRVYPTRNNVQLFNLNIRTAMHQAIYDCF